ncbi:phospholipase D-like domain-containing protein [Vibrio astriarenae]
MKLKHVLLMLIVSIVVSGCATAPQPPENAIIDQWTTQHMEDRRWRSPKEQDRDYIKLASESALPHQDAWIKVVGTDMDSGLQSIADKIYLIDHAKHTLDLTYYIFSTDIVGTSVLGALCEAVQRGVDIRLMVDSLGSFGMDHQDLKGLKQCENKAGYVISKTGEVTEQRARIQIVIFNALTKWESSFNRRSHDKLLIADGAYPNRAALMTGGRNISVHYYGLTEEAEPDPTAFKDIEVIIKPLDNSDIHNSPTQLAEYYYSVLFSKPGNKDLSTILSYNHEMKKQSDVLKSLRESNSFKRAYLKAGEHLQAGFTRTETRFAHELDNLINTELIGNYSHNKLANANSISGILGRVSYGDQTATKVRVVSPYLFLQSDLLKDEKRMARDVNVTLTWLEKDPNRQLEIITNSVLTSDNFFTQAVIDMHTAPNMLMSEEDKKLWLDSDLSLNEENSDFLKSESWQKLVNHPRIFFYQLGKPDAVNLGGSEHYGKLHAKFLVVDDRAFVGTTNLDFRSLIYNNEMGFFLFGGDVINTLNSEFDRLKAQSSRWGSAEWIEMRRKVRENGGTQGFTTKNQRTIYSTLENTGLIYQF